MSPSRRPERSDVSTTSLIATTAPALTPQVQAIAIPGTRPEPAAPQPDGSTGDLLVDPIDPTKVTGTPEERFAAFEAALDKADATAGAGLRRVKARHIIETGTVLRAIQEDDELLAALGMTWTQFITERRGMSLSRAYQYMEAAPALLRVWTSKILEAPPNESQARVLAPIIEAHGEAAARKTTAAVVNEGGKPTAAALTAAAKKLGYTPPAAPARSGDEQNNTSRGEGGQGETISRKDADAVRAALKAQQAVWRALPPNVVTRACEQDPSISEVLADLEKEALRTAKRARHRPKSE